MQDISKILEDSWLVEFDPNAAYECEWGSSSPIGFANATMHDSEGTEIEVPKCPKCDASMSCMIGKEAYMWVCTMGCDNGSE